jgi:hypothetical protein
MAPKPTIADARREMTSSARITAPGQQAPELAEAEEWLRDWPSDKSSWSARNKLCMLIASELDRLRSIVAAQVVELTALREAAENASPWPVDEVLAKLAEAADILLNEKNYDGHGYELIEVARKAARRQGPAMRAALTARRVPEPTRKKEL